MRTKFNPLAAGLLAGLCLLIGFTPLPAAQGRKDIEKHLREFLAGRVATLRNFYKDNDLKFDSNGILIGESKTGPWTYFARVEISAVKLTNDSLVISGNRNVSQWEETEFRNTTLDHSVTITIQLPAVYSETTIEDLLNKVFLGRETRLADITPSYWKEILTTGRQRRERWEQQKAAQMKNVSQVGPEIVPPKLLSKAEGVQLSPAPFKDVSGNNLVLSFIVEPNGEVKHVEIERPIGLGIDDPIAELVSQWKFEPASKDGQPVAVLMYGKFTYRERPSGHIDPYHTNPCPKIENVFAC